MSEKQIKAVSFVGGLVFFSIVVGALLIKNDRIRAEVEEQAMSLLKTTKSAVNQIQFIVSKIGKITLDKKSVKTNNNIKEPFVSDEDSEYDGLWNVAEAQNKEFVKSHSSR